MPGFRFLRALSVPLALATAALPSAVRADDAEVHTFHCLHGCPVGSPRTNDLIVREIYTLSSNDQTKLADWVAYRVRPETIGRSESRRWAADPWLAADETLEPADYTGAPAALRIDRGHQAPLASFSGTAFAADTNYLSNITPQRSDLNQASWQFLESAERRLATGSSGAVYVLTGPLFERDMPGLPRADEPHRVPSGYWKVVATEDGRISSFIFEQETARSANFCTMRVAIADVERRARLQLFPRMNPRRLRSLDSELGCS